MRFALRDLVADKIRKKMKTIKHIKEEKIKTELVEIITDEQISLNSEKELICENKDLLIAIEKALEDYCWIGKSKVYFYKETGIDFKKTSWGYFISVFRTKKIEKVVLDGEEVKAKPKESQSYYDKIEHDREKMLTAMMACKNILVEAIPT